MSAKKTARPAPIGPSTEKPRNKGGRPKINIDPEMVEKLAGIGCPDSEIAAIVNCSVDTLTRRFADVLHKGRENCKTRLRKKQIEVALAGNVSMLIWLGKQMLAQSEKVEAKTELSGSINGTLDDASKKAVDEWARQIQSKIRKSRTRGK
jgi:hypothetical protein